MTRPLTGFHWWHYASLRWRFLLVGIVSLAPIMAVTNQVYTDARESALASTRQSVELLAALAAQSDNDVIADARMLLSFLAEAPELRRGGTACELPFRGRGGPLWRAPRRAWRVRAAMPDPRACGAAWACNSDVTADGFRAPGSAACSARVPGELAARV